MRHLGSAGEERSEETILVRKAEVKKYFLIHMQE